MEWDQAFHTEGKGPWNLFCIFLPWKSAAVWSRRVLQRIPGLWDVQRSRLNVLWCSGSGGGTLTCLTNCLWAEKTHHEETPGGRKGAKKWCNHLKGHLLNPGCGDTKKGPTETQKEPQRLCKLKWSFTIHYQEWRKSQYNATAHTCTVTLKWKIKSPYLIIA